MSGEDVASFVFGTITLTIASGLIGSVFGVMLAAIHNLIIADLQPGHKDYTWHPFKRMWKIVSFPLRPFRGRTRKLEERLARAHVLEDHLTEHVGRLAPDDPWKPYFDTLKVEATRKRETISTDLKQAVAQGYAKKLKEIGE